MRVMSGLKPISSSISAEGGVGVSEGRREGRLPSSKTRTRRFLSLVANPGVFCK